MPEGKAMATKNEALHDTFTPGRVLLRLPSVRRKTGLGRSTIYRLIAAGQFPAPIKLGPATSAWDAAAVDEWIAARCAEMSA
jgi:prophage regulatory protein